MATAYTTLLGLALPVTGELNGTWGDVVNDSITELVEDAIAGSATASVTSADWTLTTTGSGAANQARSAILIPTGTPGVSRNIIAPSSSKAYIVDNQSNGAVVVKGAATTGATIATNTAALVAWDGADFVLVAQDLANATGTLPVTKGGTGATTLTGVVKGTGTSALTAGTVNLASEVTGTLPVANGGTGQTTYTNGQLLIGNTTGNTLAKATLTQGSGVTITNGAGSITIAATGSGGTVTSVAVSGGTTGLTVSGSPITTTGTITLAGTLAVANGGTGATTLTANNVVLGNGTSAPLFVAPSTSGNVLTSNGTTWTSATPAGGGSLLRQIVFTSSGTWTKGANTKYVLVQVVGGGGGGGGTAANIRPGGGGGGAGGYANKFIDVTTISTETVTIGTGGAGAIAGGNNGSAGGNSSFGAHCTGNGGGGGFASSNPTNGGTGGSATSGDINITGGGGGTGTITPGGNTSGTGGSSFFGGGARGIGDNGAGETGNAYGSGGSGGVSSGSTQAGGAGQAGLVVVWEYT